MQVVLIPYPVVIVVPVGIIAPPVAIGVPPFLGVLREQQRPVGTVGIMAVTHRFVPVRRPVIVVVRIFDVNISATVRIVIGTGIGCPTNISLLTVI